MTRPPNHNHTNRRRLAALLPLVASIALATPALAAGASAQAQRARTLVVLRDGAESPGAVAGDHGRRFGARAFAVYESALRGYAAELTPAAREAIARDPRVAYVELDRPVSVNAQSMPTGLDRIEGDRQPMAAVDGIDTRVDVDIAVLDTGIAAHPDLNVVGGARCVGLASSPMPACTAGGYADGNGHGTHVAGIAGALDNGIGVVGVAPGARLWAVKVLNDSGSGMMSELLAGLDWVRVRTSAIEVANMSLGEDGTSQALDDAITHATNSGLVVAVSAGNAAKDAATQTPANSPRAIAVSAVADFDGKRGGTGAATCRYDGDDTFADFSNYGSVVDIAAPGVCITSTWANGTYATISGTSMASPYVAGAAALYVAQWKVPRSSTRWSSVLLGLQTIWSVPQTSPCGFTQGRSAERMLFLAPCPP